MAQCDFYQQQMSLFLSGMLNEEETARLNEHLSLCTSCSEEMTSIKALWAELDAITIEEPSAGMQASFNAILKNYKEDIGSRKNIFIKWNTRIKQLWQLQPRLQLAYSLLMIIVGIGMGYYLSNKPNVNESATKDQINLLALQVTDMQRTLMVTLLENPSASERIRAVNYTNEINKADIKIIQALLATLNNDPNVNVRLATLEALTKFAREPNVREGLVQSIQHQESPIVQTAIAELMVKLQEKRSVKPLQQLLNKKDVDELVKAKIKESLHQLI